MPLACDRAWAIQVWIAFIRAADTDVCAMATEPAASNATIRTGAAKIETDAMRARFRIFDILGLPIVRREAAAFLHFGGSSVRVNSRREGERKCSHSANIEADDIGDKDQRQ